MLKGGGEKQLKTEIEMRKSLAQAEASSVEKDKRLQQAQTQVNNTVQQVAGGLESTLDVVKGLVQGRYVRLNERDQQHAEGVLQELSDIHRQLKQQGC